MTRTKEPFTAPDNAVSIYVCGITPYDTTHLGHSFTYATFDTLIRYLEYTGFDVTYVQNVTDIDDDILRKAKEVGENWKEVGDRWTAHFIRDMQALNIRPPDYFPRATDVIAEIINTVEALLAAGFAYEADGNVYFHVDDWKEFGALSQIPRREMLPVANERGNRPDDPHKKDPLDFVLWQTQAKGEPGWESPWGLGRPGWHIECSTMATDLLGDTIDIHGGGADLIFPHHECEIAQAEGATGKRPFVRFWMHTAMVRHEGEKMSKSLGNLVMVRDLLESGWHPDAIRLYMHRHHYREPWEYHDESLQQAAASAELLRRAVTAAGGSGERLNPRGALNTFRAAMDDDLDTATALFALEQLSRELLLAADEGKEIEPAQAVLRDLASIMGLRLDAAGPEARVIAGWDEHLKRFT
jgi:L-cysteine:1D-myo-inositol 2-amino-2-deoxy-alpha-D-glucopyranoside ligase